MPAYGWLVALMLSLGWGWPAKALAQRPERAATRVDSLRAVRAGKPACLPAEFLFVGGKKAYGYVPDAYLTCFIDHIPCYDTNPESIPRPALKKIEVTRLKSVVINGRQYESLYLNGKPLGLLAENLAVPGPVQLFGYSKAYSPIPFAARPPEGALFVPADIHEKHCWYIRRGQTAELIEVPRSAGNFAKAIAPFFANDPVLAERVWQRAKGARFENITDLVQEFNEHATAK